jgi:hypothetical protein
MGDGNDKSSEETESNELEYRCNGDPADTNTEPYRRAWVWLGGHRRAYYIAAKLIKWMS